MFKKSMLADMVQIKRVCMCVWVGGDGADSKDFGNVRIKVDSIGEGFYGYFLGDSLAVAR